MNYRKETELGPDAIQKWCEELDRKKTSNEYYGYDIHFLRHSKCENDIEKIYNSGDKEGFNRWYGAPIFYERIKKYHSFTATKAVMMFLGLFFERPGMVVEYCNYMQYKCWKHGIKHIDMLSFSVFICPEGFFSEETLHEMWEKQKIISKDGGGLANMLDYPEFMESIREIKEK